MRTKENRRPKDGDMKKEDILFVDIICNAGKTFWGHFRNSNPVGHHTKNYGRIGAGLRLYLVRYQFLFIHNCILHSLSCINYSGFINVNFRNPIQSRYILNSRDNTTQQFHTSDCKMYSWIRELRSNITSLGC